MIVENRAAVLENHWKIRQVPCPRCGAAKGAACKGPNGKPTSMPHQARRSAAADAGLYKP